MSNLTHFSEAPVVFRARSRTEGNTLARALVAANAVSAREMLHAQHLTQHQDVPLCDLIVSLGLATEDDVANTLADIEGLRVVDPKVDPPQLDLVTQFGVERALDARILPWRRDRGAVIVLCHDPDRFAHALPDLAATFGRVKRQVATDSAIETWFVENQTAALSLQAESWGVPELTSRTVNFRQIGWIGGAALLAGILLLILHPLLGIALLGGAAICALCVNMTLRLCASWAALRGKGPPKVEPPPEKRPVVTLLIPLFKEEHIADKLIKRLEALSYPRTALDVLLILEEGDTTTHATLNAIDLPAWMRVLQVPKGSIQTKPRAMNYALSFARGSIIGVYDAEDAPDPQQIQRMVAKFTAEPGLSCLQAKLAFYNVRANWLSRCFAIEYAIWFGLILPGLIRLGSPIPLGGTSVFFRRDALQRAGRWDAHNVTEDADLGFRLARMGYTVGFLDSTTYEEANNRAWPWVRQRSRWLKGYLLTWIVHMRHPFALLKDLGPKGFVVFNALLLGTVLQFLLAPILWISWGMTLGLPIDAVHALPVQVLIGLSLLFIATEAANMLLGAIAALRAGRADLVKWTPTLIGYFPLATAAMLKALSELITRPFYWDKTAHGISAVTDPAAAIANTQTEANHSPTS